MPLLMGQNMEQGRDREQYSYCRETDVWTTLTSDNETKKK